MTSLPIKPVDHKIKIAIAVDVTKLRLIYLQIANAVWIKQEVSTSIIP